MYRELDKELKSVIENCQYFNIPGVLYRDLIKIDKKSFFDNFELIKFFIAMTYVGSGNKDLSQLMDNMNKIDRANDEQLNKINKTVMKQNEQYDGWIPVRVYTREETVKPSEYIKLYLSVDNSTLHLFANQFILACLNHGYDDFDFKINQDENINRRDNVVIYCTCENLGKYISLVKEVISNNVLVFNSPHLLGAPYNEYIYCGIDQVDDKNSYTDRMCESIINSLNKEESIDDVINRIDMFKMRTSSHINGIVENYKDKNRKH